MRWRSLVRGAFWSAVVLLLVFHLAGGLYFSGVLIDDGFTPDPEPIVTADTNVELNEVVYTSPVGDLDALHIPAPGSTWVIHVHGRTSTPTEAEHLFEPIQSAGYPQLAITFRNDEGQPSDPSGYYQYGSTEWEDIKGAVEFAQANGAEDIVLSGFSTGAGHILSFIYKNNLDVVKGLVFDSPNIDFGETVDYNASQRDMPVLPMKVPSTLAEVAKFITSLRIGVNWKAIDYVEKAGTSLRVPVLVHHGTVDQTVPVGQSIEFAEQNPELISLFQVQGAGHIESYETNPEAYVTNVLEFLAEVG